MPDRLRVGILFGGRSGEHPISIRSSRYVVDSLDGSRFEPVLIGIDRAGRWHLCAGDAYRRIERDVAEGEGVSVIPACGDRCCNLYAAGRFERPLATVDVAFPVLHGPFGEDGTVQGLLETLGVPYVGVGVLAAAVCMDKDVCKRLLRDAGVSVVPFEVVTARRWTAEPQAVMAAAARLGPSLFVKPASLGSSLGVTRVDSAEALPAALERALALDAKVLIERAIEGREIECAVLGNDLPEASLPGEIVPGEAFYSFDDKYAATSAARLVIPAPLSPSDRARIRDTAICAFRALECSGMARVDFFLERDAGALYVNELNTIPGFTSISMYPKLWEASGVPGTRLVSRLIELALERHAERRRLAGSG